jgi:hypothetical protein
LTPDGRSTTVSGSVFVANFSLTASAVFLVILLSSSCVQRQKRSGSGGHLPEPVRRFRRLLVRRTSYRLLIDDSRVPIRRRRVITADASLGPRSAGICPYLPAPVRVPGWRGTQSRVSGDGSGLLQWDVEGGPPPRQALWRRHFRRRARPPDRQARGTDNQCLQRAHLIRPRRLAGDRERRQPSSHATRANRRESA